VDCRSDFVTADVAGGVGVLPLDGPSIGGSKSPEYNGAPLRSTYLDLEMVGVEIREIMLERFRRYWTQGKVVPPHAQDLEPRRAVLEVLP
jgi:hypothetical protein